jgi:UDP-2,3-diacylglucosamine hydrolase
LISESSGLVKTRVRDWERDYPRPIHGHTHRPARHEHRVDGRVCERWVLPDWYESGGVLTCDEKGCGVEKL